MRPFSARQLEVGRERTRHLAEGLFEGADDRQKLVQVPMVGHEATQEQARAGHNLLPQRQRLSLRAHALAQLHRDEYMNVRVVQGLLRDSYPI